MRLPVIEQALGDDEAAERIPPQEIVAWAVERFHANVSGVNGIHGAPSGTNGAGGTQLVISTGFGMEGCAMIDMLSRLARPLAIRYLDTGFLFPETHALRERLEARYPQLTFERVSPDLTPEEQERLYGAALWKREPDHCCEMRKVVPMRTMLRGASAWMTAVRRSQSASRASTLPVAWDWAFEVVKVSPLAAWSREEVWQYVRTNDVPYNELHDRGYPSVGCTHCTAPVAGATPAEYSRAGRWEGTSKTECGLHARRGGPARASEPTAHGRETGDAANGTRNGHLDGGAHV